MNKGDFKLSPSSEKILSTVRPDLQRVIRRAAELTTVPFAVVSGNRTAAEQARLYSQGRSRPGLVVTWVDGVRTKSNHQGGAAIDFSAVDDKGKPTNHLKHTWSTDYYKPIADVILAAGEELGIPVEWPLWRKGDFGHIQLRKPYRPITIPEMAARAPQKPAQPVWEQNVNLPPPADLSRPQAAVAFLEGLGWEKHQAAAIVANGVWESGGRDHLKTTALGDKDKDGRWTAHGAFQWRGDRYSGPGGLMSFTMTHCPTHSSSEPWVQLRFAHWELTEGNERRAGNMLKEAKTLEEANKAAISFLRPVHWTKDAPEKGHGFQRRLEIAQWIMGQRATPK
jgi:peptidoglycan L-alanyl-D-glutamate endopeptidase CwlK